MKCQGEGTDVLIRLVNAVADVYASSATVNVSDGTNSITHNGGNVENYIGSRRLLITSSSRTARRSEYLLAVAALIRSTSLAISRRAMLC